MGIVGNLDADLSFEEDYFAFLLEKFVRDPRLGVGGTPFSEGERKLLGEDAPEHPLPEELRQRFTKLIGQLLEKEQEIGAEADPKSFGNSLEWAGDPAYPNVVALTEGLVISRRPPESLRGRLRREMKDLMQVIGCGLTIVLLLAIVVVFCVWMFGRR